MDPTVIADAVAAAIEAAGFDTDTLNIYSHPEADPELPALIVWPGASPFITYQDTFGPRGVITTNWRIELRVSIASDEGNAYRTMYGFLGVGTSTSVFDVLAADTTLDGLVDVTNSLEVSTVRRVSEDRAPHISADFPLSCTQRRSA